MNEVEHVPALSTGFLDCADNSYLCFVKILGAREEDGSRASRKMGYIQLKYLFTPAFLLLRRLPDCRYLRRAFLCHGSGTCWSAVDRLLTLLIAVLSRRQVAAELGGLVEGHTIWISGVALTGFFPASHHSSVSEN